MSSAAARYGPPPSSVQPDAGGHRILAIDWFRGVVMVLMALDHVRYFVSDVPFSPEDIDRTNLTLFMTRWVTHFCAPMFFFLAGTSAYLSGARRPNSLRRHLLTRGLWLVVLEITIVGFAWAFVPGYSFAGVIWALGWSMVILAAVINVDARIIAAASLLIIALHDLLNGMNPSSFGALEPLWRLLHVPGEVQIGRITWSVLYPLIPWFAVMTLGYATGRIWTWEANHRSRTLALWGSTATALFIILRVSNAYGNPAGKSPSHVPFAFYGDAARTLISLLNVSKYPPSLQYLLMTLGPSMIVLAAADRRLQPGDQNWPARALITFGRVPLFYYVCHLYLIHGVAAFLLRGHRFPLSVVYAVWIVLVAALYVPCRAFERLKRSSATGWLRYA